jgi:4'-phosphopantetheinyl transferase
MPSVLAHWKLVDRVMNLNRFDVHVWQANLDQPPQVTRELEETLSIAELSRAKKFVSQRDRSRFLVSHVILRKMLGGYLNAEPTQLVFRYQSLGKPYLSSKYERSGISFNFSHAQNVGLFALACKREIGADIEFIRFLPEMGQIASKYYSPTVYHLLTTMSDGQKIQVFFDFWTRKEAFLKALGVGFTYPTDGLDVSIALGEAAQLLQVQGYSHETGRWRLEDLSPAPGYADALAAEGHDWHLSCWEYSPSPGLATFRRRKDIHGLFLN